MEDTIKVVSKNQYLLFLIYETIFYDLQIEIEKLKLEPNILTFIVGYHEIDIRIYNDNLILYIDKISKLEECVDSDNIFEDIIRILLNNFTNYNLSKNFNQYNLFFKFIKLSSLFELEYALNKNYLTIYNRRNNIKMSVTVHNTQSTVYKINIKNNDKVVLNEFLLEYDNKINELSTFYDKDKSQQIVQIISYLFKDYQNKE